MKHGIDDYFHTNVLVCVADYAVAFAALRDRITATGSLLDKRLDIKYMGFWE